MRRCPVAAWEGWTTKPLHENTKKGGRGKPSAAQSYPATERRNRAPSQISRWLPASRPEQVKGISLFTVGAFRRERTSDDVGCRGARGEGRHAGVRETLHRQNR